MKFSGWMHHLKCCICQNKELHQTILGKVFWIENRACSLIFHIINFKIVLMLLWYQKKYDHKLPVYILSSIFDQVTVDIWVKFFMPPLFFLFVSHVKKALIGHGRIVYLQWCINAVPLFHIFLT